MMILEEYYFFKPGHLCFNECHMIFLCVFVTLTISIKYPKIISVILSFWIKKHTVVDSLHFITFKYVMLLITNSA